MNDLDIVFQAKVRSFIKALEEAGKKDGSLVDIPFNPNVNSNVALHAVGQFYGVYKLKTDKPHWSHDGR